MTRRFRALAGTALIACAIATPLGGRALERACAAGNVHIAIVVDAGNGSPVSAVCIPAGARDNGATILAARASRLGTPQPRYNAAGLLCAIDGVPQTGCGNRSNGHYAYWAYFHGSGGKWTYTNFGPASWRADPGTVEGWRFQPDGAGLPTDPPPRGPANPTAICIPAAPPTTARAVVSGTTTPHAGPGVTTLVAQPGVTTPTGPPTVATQPTGGSPTSRPTPDTTARTTTATTARGHPSTTVAADATSGSPSTTFALTSGGIAAPTSGRSSGGVPVGAIAGALVLIALGSGGAIAARRRSRPAS